MQLNQHDDEPLWSHFNNELVASFCQSFYWTKGDFLNPSLVQQLLDWCLEIEKQRGLRPASIGKGTLKSFNEDVRSDKIYWLDDFQSSPGQLVFQLFQSLQNLARKEFYLPVKRFECHFSKYEKGNFYRKHRDRHSFNPSRLITCVLYLNEVKKGQGGELILYDENAHPILIRPEPGRIVIFDSSLEHEVRPCLNERWSLTGWLRSDSLPGFWL